MNGACETNTILTEAATIHNKIITTFMEVDIGSFLPVM